MSNNHKPSGYPGTTDPLLTIPVGYVTITVDRDSTRQSFIVSRDMICHASPLFKAALEREETTERPLKLYLEDVEAEIFGYVAHWVYEGELGNPYAKSRHSGAAGSAIELPHPLVLAKLWKLGRRLLMPELQNATMRLFYCVLDIATEKTLSEVAKFVWLDRGSTMLKSVLVSKFAFSWSGSYATVMLPFLPPTMVFDIVVSVKLRMERAGLAQGLRQDAQQFFVDVARNDLAINRGQMRNNMG